MRFVSKQQQDVAVARQAHGCAFGAAEEINLVVVFFLNLPLNNLPLFGRVGIGQKLLIFVIGYCLATQLG